MRRVLKLAAERRRRAVLEFQRHVETLALRDARFGDIEKDSREATEQIPASRQDARPSISEELP
ncbi:MAG TPA: hypothetical protein VFG53_08320 [Anaeromyxobacter sp.]|nr:hypothetical protein [Anaeromyxobacter sp.]